MGVHGHSAIDAAFELLAHAKEHALDLGLALFKPAGDFFSGEAQHIFLIENLADGSIQLSKAMFKKLDFTSATGARGSFRAIEQLQLGISHFIKLFPAVSLQLRAQEISSNGLDPVKERSGFEFGDVEIGIDECVVSDLIHKLWSWSVQRDKGAQTADVLLHQASVCLHIPMLNQFNNGLFFGDGIVNHTHTSTHT
jgi:hypothetical protein